MTLENEWSAGCHGDHPVRCSSIPRQHREHRPVHKHGSRLNNDEYSSEFLLPFESHWDLDPVVRNKLVWPTSRRYRSQTTERLNETMAVAILPVPFASYLERLLAYTRRSLRLSLSSVVEWHSAHWNGRHRCNYRRESAVATYHDASSKRVWAEEHVSITSTLWNRNGWRNYLSHVFFVRLSVIRIGI